MPIIHPAHEPVKKMLRTFDSNATPEIAMHRAQLILFMLARNGWLTGAVVDHDHDVVWTQTSNSAVTEMGALSDKVWSE